MLIWIIVVLAILAAFYYAYRPTTVAEAEVDLKKVLSSAGAALTRMGQSPPAGSAPPAGTSAPPGAVSAPPAATPPPMPPASQRPSNYQAFRTDTQQLF